MNRTTKLLSLFTIAVFLFSFTGCVDKAKDKLIEQMADVMNKQCPMVLDFATTLKNCEAVPGGIFKYNYVVDINVADIDTVLVRESFYDDIVYNLQHNDALKPLKIAKVSFIHNYKTKNGDKICEIKVGPDDYKNDVDQNKTISDEEIYRRLLRNANFMKAIKVPVDEITTIKDVQVVRPKTLEYSYTLHGVEKSEIDTVYFKSVVRTNAVNSLKTNPRDAILRNNNVIFRHIYFDKDDKCICVININPEDYK